MKNFKGWTLPDSDVVAENVNSNPPGEDETCDALCGQFLILQKKKGYRFSTDELVTAHFIYQHSIYPKAVLELGCGQGTVSLFLAWKWQGVNFTGVEAQETSFRLAQRNIQLNALQSRFHLHHQDLRSLELSEKFQVIASTPPYFNLTQGVRSEIAQIDQGRFETRGSIADYASCALKHIAPGGSFFSVLPWSEIDKANAVNDEHSEWQRIRTTRVIFKEGGSEGLGLFQWMRKSDLPAVYINCLPTPNGIESDPIIVRAKNGEVTPTYATLKLEMGFPPTLR